MLQGTGALFFCFTAAQLRAVEALAGDKPVLPWRMKLGEVDGQLVLSMTDASRIDGISLQRIDASIALPQPIAPEPIAPQPILRR